MSNTLVVDRIETNLTRLRLPKIREILERVLKSAEHQDTSLSFGNWGGTHFFPDRGDGLGQPPPDQAGRSES